MYDNACAFELTFIILARFLYIVCANKFSKLAVKFSNHLIYDITGRIKSLTKFNAF